MKKLLIALFSCLFIFTGCDFIDRIMPDAVQPIRPDEVEIELLNWDFGGFSGRYSKLSDARIGNLKATGNDMSYKWISDNNDAVKQLNSSSKSNPDLYACLFVKKSDGKWVGGKFEWISVSRTTRQFGNILAKPYGGWSLNGVPNPCDCAFVIINPKTKSRTNIIKGTWKR